ncbi:MAG TPA: NADH-quinone oxidoreductase subunit N [Acidimicrobiales bacterium]|nr:NADH-quinone oxidoreductase subunit N [Acidimicrobiales bacterium]
MSLAGILGLSGLVTPHVDYVSILPELILSVAALLMMLAASLFRRAVPRGTWAISTAVVAAASIGASWYLWDQVQHHGAHTAVNEAVAVDGFSVFFLMLISVALALGALLADDYLRREGLDGPEFYVLAMLSAAGAMFLAVANDLIVVFLGLETLSIALYVLAGYHLRRRESSEAAIKYFVLGAFSSAVFLYGVALTYGATGSTNLAKIGAFLAGNQVVDNGVLLAGMAMLIVGLGFKVAAVPFHAWSPDVYQGAPTPVTGYMAAVAKAAGFAGLLRVLYSSFSLLRTDWQPVITVLAALTLVVGAVAALVQTDIKRLMAYSSINHAGFVLVGLAAATSQGISGALYYLFAYTFMVIGSFAVITLVGRQGDARHRLEDYRGLARARPVLAAVFALLLFAQSGVPFTTGFLAKFSVISAAMQARSYPLAILAMLSAAVAAVYYLRVIFLMYASAPEPSPELTTALAVSVAGGGPGVSLPSAGAGEPVDVLPVGDDGIAMPPAVLLVLGLCAAFTVAMGLWPDPIVDFARHASLLF